MKKIICLLILCILSQPVLAKTIHVEALADFSTENPPRTFAVKALDDLTFDKDLSVTAGDILEGKIVDVKNPKRLKRDATFSFVPLTKSSNGNVTDIKGYYPAKYTTKLNKGEIAKSAALGVGNHFVKGLSMGYSALEGAVKNEEGNRLKSSASAVYESSPFSYVEKGGNINIEKGQTFLLNFKVKEDDENLPNYEYTELSN